jgi:hypothetical protein
MTASRAARMFRSRVTAVRTWLAVRDLRRTAGNGVLRAPGTRRCTTRDRRHGIRVRQESLDVGRTDARVVVEHDGRREVAPSNPNRPDGSAACRLYEGGRGVNRRSRCSFSGRAGWVVGVSGAHLSIAPWCRGSGVMGGSFRWRISKESRQAARRQGAPAGAKGWLRVSMCQKASASLRERSIWATLGPRWRPRRFLVRA